jgi:uncharacterized protein
MPDAGAALADTRRWLERAVIGLNLCPFAKAVHVKGQVHYAASEAEDAQGVLEDFTRELEGLLALPARERDTTLLVVPRGMGDFLTWRTSSPSTTSWRAPSASSASAGSKA